MGGREGKVGGKNAPRVIQRHLTFSGNRIEYIPEQMDRATDENARSDHEEDIGVWREVSLIPKTVFQTIDLDFQSAP